MMKKTQIAGFTFVIITLLAGTILHFNYPYSYELETHNSTQTNSDLTFLKFKEYFPPNNTLIVVGNKKPHGFRKKRAGPTDYSIAQEIMNKHAYKNRTIDTNITSMSSNHYGIVMDDKKHNLIAIGCHWINQVSWHYLIDKRFTPMIGVYVPGDPLDWPHALYSKKIDQKIAHFKTINRGDSDYGLLELIKEGDRHVLILWSYHTPGTIAGSKILLNLDKADNYDWNIDGKSLVFWWYDDNKNKKVEPEEISITPY